MGISTIIDLQHEGKPTVADVGLKFCHEFKQKKEIILYIQVKTLRLSAIEIVRDTLIMEK